MVHTLPTSRQCDSLRIPPTESVDGSYSAYIEIVRLAPNPTDGVGGLFIPNLQKADEAFQNPTDGVGGFFIPSLQKADDSLRIPPTESVDCSYPTYKGRRGIPE